MCHDAYHPGVECVSTGAREAFLAAREKLLEEGGGDGGGAVAQSRKRLAEARAKLEELKSLEVIRRTSKPCPSCGAGIMRTEGCNHMRARPTRTKARRRRPPHPVLRLVLAPRSLHGGGAAECRMCSTHFCWQCNQIISDANPVPKR